MINFLRTAGAVTLAATLLTACSHDKPDDAAAAPVAPPASEAPAPGEIGVPPSAGAVSPGGGAAALPGGLRPPATPQQVIPTSGRPTQYPVPNFDAARTRWVAGKVTRASSHCIGLRDDDGVSWAVYSPETQKLTKGQRIRARLAPGATKESCGSGQPAQMSGLQIAK